MAHRLCQIPGISFLTLIRIWVRSRYLKLFICNLVNGEGRRAKLHGSFQLEYGEAVVVVAVMETYTPAWRDANSERRPRTRAFSRIFIFGRPKGWRIQPPDRLPPLPNFCVVPLCECAPKNMRLVFHAARLETDGPIRNPPLTPPIVVHSTNISNTRRRSKGGEKHSSRADAYLWT